MIRLLIASALSILFTGCATENIPIAYSHDQVTQSIIDGSASTATDHPATAALLIRATDGQETFGDFVCSAVLVAPKVVLTAAHCISRTWGYSGCPHCRPLYPHVRESR